MDNHDAPINVIILDNIEHENESLIDAYYSIVKDCKKSSEVKAALKMMCQEQRELTLREVLVRRIQQDAKTLEDTKKH